MSVDRPRATRCQPPTRALRVASIDIGGGTTDLTDLHLRGPRTARRSSRKQEFRESFKVAGDDLLERVIGTLVLLPALSADALAGRRGAPTRARC